MQPFADIYQRACARHGGASALHALLPAVQDRQALTSQGSDRWLAQMTRCIFQAGFVWRVVDSKWNGFEDVFFGFPPGKIVLLSPEQIDRIAGNPRIIRNRQKVLSVQANAQFILDIEREHPGFGAFIADWRAQDLIGLFALMRRRGSRLGGMTGQRVLRNMGKDTYIITTDVVRCLQRSGLAIGNTVNSQRELRLVQQAFDQWHAESGRPYSHLSRICALSV